MVTATNVAATAVNTIGWLAGGSGRIVVPVYQRQYRWDIGACEQLLRDIRAVADLDDHRMHFIGSVLSSQGAGPDLLLIDGQQRITTLMLMAAALHHTVEESDPDLARELSRVLFVSEPTRTRLLPHSAWADVFESVVSDVPGVDGARESRFADNYAFFRSQISAVEAPRIWRGLQKLEHVAITLGAGANAQQIFESLNSTGEPLRDHELIHNYVLMGLTPEQQRRVEEEFWLPIERSTGEAIAQFWRQYLVMETGREIDARRRGVYDTFREVFPMLTVETLEAHASTWRDYAEVYGILRDPARAGDDEIAGHLAAIAAFGSTMHPLTMRAYQEHRRGRIPRAELIDTLELVQSLLLRRAVAGITVDRLVARLCRARAEGHDALVVAAARIMPSDERMALALKFSPLPHPRYVLGRLAGVEAAASVDVDHIVPLTPSDAWSGDGARAWADLSEDEQNSLRALAPTLGNLTLIEEPLALQAFDAPFPVKQALYRRSAVDLTTAVAETTTWNTAAIGARTAALTGRFTETWRRPQITHIDDDGLTPILDAVRRRGWPAGWHREWSYVEYQGEHWEVPDLKYLFNRVFKRLWADDRDAVVTYSARRGGPVYTEQSWTGHWDRIDDGHWLYMGWDYSYMMGAVQGVLEEAGIAPEVFVKYSYIGDAM
ncbi:hypothetical protein JOD63_001263 [Microbacterium terrae]|uniref:DUF262 domain-containing protein n=1 Tax=Microbacterium terrae TaxID=69369 RepID=A0A0M2H2N2_9MICO|nr:DUF262 domain-containing protein [Microbacterium terrae]KJL37886.1 hypothetical protein RS81_02876 [Microbacterium terrae]MBP1077295.1 hypothetical protein [Microbacterium terrae]GLJ98906.1 hypothetical protein GCM10017594_21030 [Microbacterium terrae]